MGYDGQRALEKKRVEKTKFDTKLMIQAVHIADIGRPHGIQNKSWFSQKDSEWIS